MNTFTFNGSLMKNIKDRNTFITATVVDRRPVTQADGTVRSLLNCTRNITIFDETVVKFIKENLISTGETEFMINASGYLSSSFNKKSEQWYDNQVVTELSLA